MKPQDHLIVALDFPSREPALHMVQQLGEEVLWYKVGLELYLAEGAPIVRELVERGKQVFLDLKLHDIPNTVASAVRSVESTGASLLTLHGAGGPLMLRAAVEAASTNSSLRLLAVTVLTSMDQSELNATGIPRTAAEQVALLGNMALYSGVHGLVCSPEEVCAMRTETGNGPLLVVPGVRQSTAPADDQRRTATPRDTILRGASHIVVGRPITRATDPVAAAGLFLAEISAGLALAE